MKAKGVKKHFPERVSAWSTRKNTRASPVPGYPERFIPKPPGEPGRPGKRGFALKRELQLDAELYKKIRKFAREIVRKCFPEDEIPTYRNLGTEKRWNLEQKLTEKYRFLKADYENAWAVESILATTLNNAKRTPHLQNSHCRNNLGRGSGNARQGGVPPDDSTGSDDGGGSASESNNGDVTDKLSIQETTICMARAKVTSLERDNEELRLKDINTSGQRDALESEVSRLQKELSALHASKQDLYQQFQEADEDRRKEREHISVLSVDVEKWQAQSEAAQALVASLRKELAVAHDDVMRLKEQQKEVINRLNSEVEKLRKLHHLSGTQPEYGTILRMLQDLISISGELPSCYWLKNVSICWPTIIGRGGEANVYEGTYEGNRVVIRVNTQPQSTWSTPRGEEILKLIRREVITHSQLEHRNIIPLLGVTRAYEGGPPIMVLPFIKKQSLKDYMGSAKLEIGDFAKIVIGIANALIYLHTGIVVIIHGDLHLGNVLIADDGQPLLSDFGFSRIRHEVTRTRSTNHEGGNQRYTAPELLDGPEHFRTSKASDVYALAMTYLSAGTSQQPFAIYKNTNKATKAVRERVRPPRVDKINQLSLSDARKFWTILEAMWCQEPSDRLSTEEVGHRMEVLLGPFNSS